MRSPFFLQLSEAVAQRFAPAGRFAVGFARGKLNHDPSFEWFLQHGLLTHARTVLDIGCGQGLLSGLVIEARAQAKNWPSTWAQHPVNAKVIGLELMPNDIERAQQAYGKDAEFILGDMVTSAYPPSQAVVILDVLHYVSYEDQRTVLDKVKASLQAGAADLPAGSHPRLLLRVGDAAGGLPFKISNWVDALVTFVRGHRLGKLYCKPVAQWVSELESIGFVVQVQPLNQGTPFANILLDASLRA